MPKRKLPEMEPHVYATASESVFRSCDVRKNHRIPPPVPTIKPRSRLPVLGSCSTSEVASLSLNGKSISSVTVFSPFFNARVGIVAVNALIVLRFHRI